MKKICNSTERATVYAGNSRVTVYGETARLINAITLIAALIMAVTAINKMLK